MSYLSFQDQSSQAGGAAFQSLTDALDPAPEVISKQHFVEWFSGDTIDTIWNINNVTGTGSVAMLDEVDGGLRVTPGTTAFDATQIDLGGMQHYEETASVFIGVVRKQTGTTGRMFFGGVDANYNNSHHVLAWFDTTGTLEIRTGTTEVNTTVTPGTDWIKVKLDLRSSSALLIVNGVLEAVGTGTLPTQPQNPAFGRQFVAAGDVGDIKYCEAYNT